MGELEVIKKWLKSKQTTLWADWDLTHEDRLQLAAEWFQQQMREFIAFDFKVSTEMFRSGEWDVT